MEMRELMSSTIFRVIFLVLKVHSTLHLDLSLVHLGFGNICLRAVTRERPPDGYLFLVRSLPVGRHTRNFIGAEHYDELGHNIKGAEHYDVMVILAYIKLCSYPY